MGVGLEGFLEFDLEKGGGSEGDIQGMRGGGERRGRRARGKVRSLG